jgi:hypothetical protein
MTHPLLQLLVTQPALVADHAAGYAELLGQELGVASSTWRKRLLLGAMGLCWAMVALVLSGVALMLWATGILAPGAQSWLLVVTPLVPATCAIVCWLAWRAQARTVAFEHLMVQMRADASILRQAFTA